jgi:iduronate 2-sulfatase
VQRGAFPGHSVRTERWRYTEWDFEKKGTELYDEMNDPQELHNLARDLKYSIVKKELKELLYKIHSRPVTGSKAIANAKEIYSN